MDNGTENMLDMYLFETNTLLERLDELLLEDEKEGTFPVDDVNEIFRIMHTVKGSSAMMEFQSIMTVAHRIEDLFFYIRENTMEAIEDAYKHELFDLMFRSTDYIRDEVAKLESGNPLDENIDCIVEEINTFLNKIQGSSGQDDHAAAEAPAKPEDIPAGDNSAYYIVIHFEEGCGMENLRAFMLVNSVKDACESFRFFPEDVETNPETINNIVEHGFTLAFDTEEAMESAISIIKNSGNIQTYEIFSNPEKINGDENESVQEVSPAQAAESAPAPVQQAKAPAQSGAKPQPAPAQQHTANKQSLISVNLTKLDKLMAVVGEIVITESMVTSSPELVGMKLDSFVKSARQLRKLTDELQDISMSIRMVPVSGVFQKMNRIVRDMCQKLGKDVKLTLIGEGTEVDKTIVDSIGDPIMHIVRNSMDHGIEETPEIRIANGKNPQGEIILSAQHTGSEVIISVQDDGQGINPDKVLEKAKRNGILTKPESEYSKKEILNLLMAPGFSTNENVTEYSGRGVGMDVVRKNVENVGGTVVIFSEEGEGMTTQMKIPLTLAIVDGMEISVGKSIFTVPINNIRQSFKVSREDVIHDATSGEIVKRMDNFYPIIRLHEMYNIETEITNIEDGILVWVESGEKSYCLFVDELLGEQQVVVKPLPSYLNSLNIKNHGIAGCTILGDGNISIILEVSNLYAVTSNMY